MDLQTTEEQESPLYPSLFFKGYQDENGIFRIFKESKILNLETLKEEADILKCKLSLFSCIHGTAAALEAYEMENTPANHTKLSRYKAKSLDYIEYNLSKLK